MHRPTFFVGLGGSGVKTLAHLKRLLYRSFAPEELARYYRFLFVDADDEAEWQKLRNEFKAEFDRDKTFVDKEREWYSIGGFNPQERWQFALQNPRDTFAADILRWVDPDTAASHFDNKTVTIGAGARRQLGRLCLAMHYHNIHAKLRDTYKSLNDIREDEKVVEHVQTWVVTSSCGGTGSSVFYDVMYLLAVVGNAIGGGDPTLRPVIYAPQPFFDRNQGDPELQQRFHANACAFFLELQHAFAKRAKGTFNALEETARPSADFVQKAAGTPWLPFQGALVVDTQREGAKLDFIPFASLHSTVAELLYYMLLSGAEASLRGLWENDEKNNPDSSTQTFPRYMTAGFGAVEYPAGLLRRYVEARFTRDFTQARYRATQSITQKEVTATVGRVLNETVLGKLHRFADTARTDHLDGGVRQAGAKSRFYTLGGKDLNEAALGAGALEDDLRRLDDQIAAMVQAVRADFANRFGRPDATDSSVLYGAIREDLVRLMEAQIEQKGIYSWTGPAGRPEDGLAVRLLTAFADGRVAALKRLNESNARVAQIEGKKAPSTQGLEQIKSKIVAGVADGRGLMGKLKGDKALRGLVDAFAAKKVERLKEAFDNLIVMLEVELLSYVGQEGPSVERQDYFVARVDRPSCLQQLKDQGHRIEHWLGRVGAKAEALVESAEQLVQTESQSKLTSYVPKLAEIVVANDRSPGREAQRALSRLGSLAKEQIKEALPELTRREDGEGVRWRAVCASETDESIPVTDRYLEGARAWVDRQVAADDTLKHVLRSTLKSYLVAQRDAREKVADRLSLSGVKAFSPLSSGVLTGGRPQHRLLMTADPPAPESLPVWLGFDPKETTKETHHVDPNAPERALAVKTYTLLVLESDFPWFKKLRHSYDATLSYEPHIRRGGRVWYQLGQSEARSQRAFAAAMAWAVILMGDKAKEYDHLKALFSKRLASEYEAYVHEGPLALRGKAFYLLRTPLGDGAFTKDGRLELRLEPGLYEKVAEPGQYGRVWNEFLKRPSALGSAETFHKWSAGVEHDWTEADHATVRLVDNGKQRAEAFVHKLPDVIARVKERLDALRLQRKRTPDEEDSVKVLGWVVYELEREKDDIATQALEEEGF